MTALFLVPLGCQSHDPKEDKPAVASDEKKGYEAQIAELSRQKKAGDEMIVEGTRELERTRRELDASRETASKSAAEARLSQEVLGLQKKSYDAKIADLLARLDGKGGAPSDLATPTPGATNGAKGGDKIPSSPARYRPIEPDAIVATVDGEPVTRRELMEALYFNFASSYLDTYLNAVVVQREAKRLGITITDAEAEREASEDMLRVAQEVGGDDKLNAALTEKGITREALLLALRANGRTTAAKKRHDLVERDSHEGKARFEEKVREAYDRSFGEKVEAKFLFIPVRPGSSEDDWKYFMGVASELRNQLAPIGANWADIAKVVREREKVAIRTDRQICSRSSFAKYGADRAQLEHEVFDAKDGEVSQPVRWKGGVSLMSIVSRTPATATFEEKKDSIVADIREKGDGITVEECDELVKNLRSKVKIEKHLELDQ